MFGHCNGKTEYTHCINKEIQNRNQQKDSNKTVGIFPKQEEQNVFE